MEMGAPPGGAAAGATARSKAESDGARTTVDRAAASGGDQHRRHQAAARGISGRLPAHGSGASMDYTIEPADLFSRLGHLRGRSEDVSGRGTAAGRLARGGGATAGPLGPRPLFRGSR